MNPIYLFTDGSAHPTSRIGYGAYLAITDLNVDLGSLKSCVQLKQFKDTSSSQLEIETLLWALRTTQAQRVMVFTDAQNMIGLPDRRERMEQLNYHSKAGAPLNHATLYRDFFSLTDSLSITFVKVKGHRRAHQKSQIDRLFTLVDRASREALRATVANG